MTHSERVQNAALSSISRANRFRQSHVAETSELVETDMIPILDGAYLMKIFIGTPPVERWAIADTGSDLIWYQCLPCARCYRQNTPLFDPKNSSSYMPLSCGSDLCKALPKYLVQVQVYPRCGTSNECTYFYAYLGRSYAMGELGDGGQAVSFPKTVFGCGHNNQLQGTSSVSIAGLVGLAQGGLSLVSQMGSIGRKFSYCLPPFSENTITKQRFGEETTISGNGVVYSSTPLITKPGTLSSSYFLNLEGITVGQQKVSLTSQSDGNIFIDSGTTLTMLPPSFYDQVEALVKQAIGADQFIVQNNQFKLCYTNANSIQNYPNFEVHFTGANLSLKTQNFFLFINDDVMCFAMLPTDSNGISIYGNVAQIYFEVEHNLDQKKISFAPVDCANKQ
ncbi:aspartic proteinase CDR1-like [Prosopis cineraria]|uniref:aspartic proteinase CDR1-like n=1 Tax=Prosopis cineraria TaxID=364024 RepID=UPI00240F480A|nr:aspartic proteinase CDR1-like [Prosopis cineraria]